VDPNPPQLYRSSAEFTAPVVAEPVVWISFLDLFIEDPAACAWARQPTLDTLRQAVTGVRGPQMELPGQDLAPDCRVRGRQPVDASAVLAGFAAAQAAFPGANVRPVIFYVDNVDLVPPQGILDALAALRSVPAGQLAILWPVSLPSVAQQLGAVRSTDWTFAGDPDLLNRLNTSISKYLPLQTAAAASSGPVPLLDPAHLESTQEFKVCALPDDVTIEDPPQLGVTLTVDRGQPPTVTFDLAPRIAIPKALFSNPTFSVQIEGCNGNCSRFYIREPGDEPRRWDAVHGCVLANPCERSSSPPSSLPP